jgi:hypothetical protein
MSSTTSHKCENCNCLAFFGICGTDSSVPITLEPKLTNNINDFNYAERKHNFPDYQLSSNSPNKTDSYFQQVSNTSTEIIWCKPCRQHLKHEVSSFREGFNIKICTECYNSSYYTVPPYKRKLAHNEHLVGIESNPGPKRKSDEVAIIVNQPLRKKQKTHPNRQSRANATGFNKVLRNEETGLGPVSKSYIEMICDPLDSAPIRSGFMTWIDTLLESAYVKGTTTTTSDALVLMVNPDASLSGNSGALATNKLAAYLNIGQYNTNTSSFSSQTAYNAVNANSITSTINTNRVLASGMEVIISHAATQQSGIVTVTRFNGITGGTNLDVFTPTSAQALPQSAIYTTEGGSATIKVNWLPADATDFEFSNNNVYNNGEGLYNPYMITLSGFPTGTRVFYDLITHLEGESGVATLGGNVLDEKAGPAQQTPAINPALIDEHASPEKFMRASSSIISNSSQKMQYTVAKPNIISDIVNGAATAYSTMKKMYNSAQGQFIRQNYQRISKIVSSIY